jgi:NAD(P)-dependent dehydrogenase (short-subunit alcohol dehydrogenase family)
MQHTLIVGGTRGIGYATAQQLLKADHRVTITGLTAARAASAAARLGANAVGAPLDVKDRARLADVIGAFGPIDNLLLAASSDVAWGPFARLSMDAVLAALNMKLVGYLAAAQAALRTLAAQGSITFVGGAAARFAMPGTVGLAAVNGALEAAMRTLAKELAPRRVNLVSPGLTDTEVYAQMPAAQRAQMFAAAAAGLPARKTGEPHEIAQAIALCITNRFITGSVIDIDGGARLT